MLIGLFLVWFGQPVAAATPQRPPSPLLRVFIDCDRCDADYLAIHVAFVDYVRDRAVAELHVLVTTEGTGGGGLAWTVKFIGLGRFQNHDHVLTFSTPTTATADDQRREFARILRLGLVFYVSDTSAAPQLDVTFTKPAGDAQTTAARDPWRFWVFRLNANSNINGQASTKSLYYSFNTSANRTTDHWKFSFNGNGNESRNTFILTDGSKVVSATRGWSASQLLVKSLTAHWSIGGTASISRSSYSNETRVYRVAPGVEYDVFPYLDSTRRILTLLYTVGMNHYAFDQVTIFDKLTETTPDHALNVGLTLKQPWGSLFVSTNLTQQLNNLPRYRLSSYTEANVRLFKGFSFNLSFQYDRIRNQFFLPKGAASTDDILLQIRQLATGYSYFAGFGLTYSFGSIFNNIVNPRFNGGS